MQPAWSLRDAKDAVRYRKAPQKPPEEKVPFDREKWTKEQQNLTNELNTLYHTKPPKPKAASGSGEYVPKARKTQRATQKRPRQQSLASNPMFAHGSAAG